MMNRLTSRGSGKGKTGVILAVLTACIAIVVAFVALGLKIRNLDVQAAGLGRQLAQAKTESAEQKTELNRAKNQAADLARLRSQLEIAIGRKSELQTRLDQAATQKAELAALQSRLETAARNESDLRFQLEQAKRQLAEIPPAQPKVDATESHATDRSSQLRMAEVQSADARGQPMLATEESARPGAPGDQNKGKSTNGQPAPEKTGTEVAAARPSIPRPIHMPIKTKWGRTPRWDYEGSSVKGIFVLHITSLWPDPLKIKITVSREDKTSIRSVTLAGASTMTLVNLSVGDKIVIDSEGYDSIRLTAD